MDRFKKENLFSATKSVAIYTLFFYLIKSGLKLKRVNDQESFVDIENDEKKSSKSEKRVESYLNRILKKHGITVSYERIQLICHPPIENEKNITNPDFYFQMSGIHIFVEVGCSSNNTKHKRSQLSVVEVGLNSPGKKSNIIYVQLTNKDIEELKKVKKPHQLLAYLQTRRTCVIYLKA